MGARPSSFVVPEVPVVPTRVWSEQQTDIFQWFEEGSISNYETRTDQFGVKNLIVRARAGTGKTSTIIEGVNRAPESSILVCAFSKLIADELATRVTNPAVDVMTLHALGLRILRREWRGIPVCEDRSRRADSLTDTVLAPFEQSHGEKVPYIIRRMVSQLHSKGREMLPLSATVDTLTELAYRFDHVPDDGWGIYNVDFVATHALAAMHEAATNPPTYDIGVDYADMIYLPLAWKLTARDYQLVVVDEAQDMTMAQLEIAERVCDGRLCIVGDDRQAIFGFRGADSNSLDRLKAKLGAVELPLTTTYRCAAVIVDYAKRIVPDIEAKTDAPLGTLDNCFTEDLLSNARPGDFVLSRLNAPLVSLVLQFARRGVRARMVGRDIGRDIIKILQRLKCVDGTPIDTTLDRIRAWESKQVTKLAAGGQKHLIWQIRDQAEMLVTLADDNDTTGDLLRSIDRLFADAQDIEGGHVICSSVHKAKGLEADRVFVLMDTLYRFGRTSEEVNIHYVAVTRAKTHLTLVQ